MHVAPIDVSRFSIASCVFSPTTLPTIIRKPSSRSTQTHSATSDYIVKMSYDPATVARGVTALISSYVDRARAAGSSTLDVLNQRRAAVEEKPLTPEDVTPDMLDVCSQLIKLELLEDPRKRVRNTPSSAQDIEFYLRALGLDEAEIMAVCEELGHTDLGECHFLLCRSSDGWQG